MEMQFGHHGPTGDSWRLKSVRALFADLIAKFPDASELKLVDLCAERIRDDEEFGLAAAQYIVRNAIEAREKQLRKGVIESPQSQIEGAGIVTSIKEQIMLLNLEMPNGKRLRYCVREDITKWSAGYERMAKKMKPGQMVGQAFSEDQVKALLK